ncbi:MarR family winged helix-turn-helix transcriptional regulator [Cupriavidus pauculus]|jgi:DNA-binding MarR family transcriptional regulator|uniref:MarR family winged helix-turn-helix transcriptional regulator n=1 Tax=Cupriavidus pauculus TaxID=82633 RepID=UPI000783584A|nr:MarR family transcriptional regulator [Cupriavidus pauculus]MBY4731093.1 MarR family transcriptional regulator [Cupriavidus pauculus]
MASSRQTRDPLAPDPDGGHFEPHVPHVDYGVLDSLIGYAIRRAQIRIYEDFVASLAPWNITPPRFSALQIIARNPDLKLTDLAQILGIARSGAVLLVDALESMSLVQRVPSPTDRRAYGLTLTDIGRQTLSEVTRTVCEHDARIAAGLTDQEQQMLRAMLEKLGR